MADMDFQLVIEAVVKGEEALNRLAKAEENVAKAAKAANDASAGSGKAEAAIRRESEAMQRAATASKSLGAATHAAAGASSQQAAAAARVASAERRAADATKAHAAAATMEARAVRASASAQASSGKVYRGLAADVLAADAARRASKREAAAEAASRVTPNGYLLGASGAVMMGAAVGGTAAAGIGAAAYGIRQAISFEKAMADVKKKVNLDAGATWADVERIINRNAIAFGMARENVAALAASAGAAGVEYKDLGGFIELTTKAASAWDMTPDQAADRLAKIKTQTRMTIPEMKELGDIVNTLADTGASKEADIINMLERSYASAKAAGVPLRTTAAMMTALNSGGMAPERVSTFFNAFTSTLATANQGGRGAKAAAEGFKELGTSAKEVEKGMKVDATTTMIDVLDRLEKSANKAAIGVKIFGKQYWDEATRGGQSLPEIIKNLRTANDPKIYTGSLDKNMAIDLSTTDKQLARTHEMVKQIGADLMKWTLPPINDGLQKLIDMYERLNTPKTGEKGAVAFDGKAHARAVKGALSYLPKGEPSQSYEMRLGLDRPIPQAPPKPMFQQIEGATPHIDVKQIDAAVADGVAKAAKLEDALNALIMTVTPNVNAGPAIAAMDTLAAKAASTAAAMRAIGSFGAPSTGAPSAPVGGIGKQSRISLPATGIIARGGVGRTQVAHGGTTIHYAPRVQVAGGVDAGNIKRVLSEHSTHIASLVRGVEDRRGRLSYKDTA